MKKGILYGVGVGPGDPELLTVKAVRILQEADLIAVPDKGKGEKTALHICESYIEGKELLFCKTPMIRDEEKLDAGYEEIADKLSPLLDEGKNVAFITLGDPAVYSSYMYIHEKMLKRGYEAHLVPGIPSFCAAAARLNQPLCERAEKLIIIPASHDVREALSMKGSKVFMKAGSSMMKLKEELKEAHLLDRASAVENCGMENERVFEHLADMTENSGYYSIVLLPEK